MKNHNSKSFTFNVVRTLRGSYSGWRADYGGGEDAHPRGQEKGRRQEEEAQDPRGQQGQQWDGRGERGDRWVIIFGGHHSSGGSALSCGSGITGSKLRSASVTLYSFGTSPLHLLSDGIKVQRWKPKTDGKRIADEKQTDGKKIADGQILWKERLFEDD